MTAPAASLPPGDGGRGRFDLAGEDLSGAARPAPERETGLYRPQELVVVVPGPSSVEDRGDQPPAANSQLQDLRGPAASPGLNGRPARRPVGANRPASIDLIADQAVWIPPSAELGSRIASDEGDVAHGGAGSPAAMAGGAGPTEELLGRVGADTTALAARARFTDPRLALVVAGWLVGFRSARTRRAYGADLAAFAAWCAPRGLDVLAARRVQVDLHTTGLLDAGAAKSSVARRLSALSSFYRFAAAHDLRVDNPVGCAASRSTRTTPAPSD